MCLLRILLNVVTEIFIVNNYKCQIQCGRIIIFFLKYYNRKQTFCWHIEGSIRALPKHSRKTWLVNMLALCTCRLYWVESNGVKKGFWMKFKRHDRNRCHPNAFAISSEWIYGWASIYIELHRSYYFIFEDDIYQVAVIMLDFVLWVYLVKIACKCETTVEPVLSSHSRETANLAA